MHINTCIHTYIIHILRDTHRYTGTDIDIDRNIYM